MYVVSHCSAIGNGEESIPMLMFNHSEKEDSISRNRPQSNVDKSPPRLVEIAVSNPGTPIKVVEIKSTTASLIPTGWYPKILTYTVAFPIFNTNFHASRTGWCQVGMIQGPSVGIFLFGGFFSYWVCPKANRVCKWSMV